MPATLPDINTEHLAENGVERARCLMYAFSNEKLHEQARATVYGYYRTVAPEVKSWFHLAHDAGPFDEVLHLTYETLSSEQTPTRFNVVADITPVIPYRPSIY
jgi:hypothetical protein